MKSLIESEERLINRLLTWAKSAEARRFIPEEVQNVIQGLVLHAELRKRRAEIGMDPAPESERLVQ